MTILSEEEVKDIGNIAGDNGCRYCHTWQTRTLNLIDTITDKDRQIRELEGKVEALELKLHRPFPNVGNEIKNITLVPPSIPESEVIKILHKALLEEKKLTMNLQNRLWEVQNPRRG